MIAAGGEERVVFSSVVPSKSTKLWWKVIILRIFEQHKVALIG